MTHTVSNNLNINNSTIERSFYPMIGMLWANMELGHKVVLFISHWNFCNFISQLSKLVIKLMVKMAFGNVGITLASVQSGKTWGILPSKDPSLWPVAGVPVPVSLCQSQAPLFSTISLFVAFPSLWFQWDSCAKAGNVWLVYFVVLVWTL